MPGYPRLGLPLPVELVNTAFVASGQPSDALATRRDLEFWLRANAAHFPTSTPAATARNLARFRQLRDALRQLFGALVEASPPPRAALQVLNELSAEAPQVARLDWRAGAPHLRMVELADARNVGVAIVARAGIAFIAGPDHQHLRRCQAPGCVLFFLHEGRRGQWCSGTCGNRARVARHYARHHPTRAEDIEPQPARRKAR